MKTVIVEGKSENYAGGRESLTGTNGLLAFAILHP
jgi:hypothetical protein